jgi:hypothetical protein
MKNPDKRGGKGMHPLGREGVTLLAPVREYANNGGKKDSNRAVIPES